MNLLSVKLPTIPIPLHKYLKVMAIVDATDPQTKRLLDDIAAEKFEIEITDRFERDVSEDAGVGAYIAFIDGDRAEKAQALARAVRAMRPRSTSVTSTSAVNDDTSITSVSTSRSS